MAEDLQDAIVVVDDEPQAPHRPRGRPTIYTAEIGQAICDLIADGWAVVDICALESMPDRVTIWRWRRIHDDFCNMYVRAREERAEAFADEIVRIADSATPKTVELCKLRCDARKWVAVKLLPKVYGPPASTQTINGPVQINVGTKDPASMSLDELDAYIAERERRLMVIDAAASVA